MKTLRYCILGCDLLWIAAALACAILLHRPSGVPLWTLFLLSQYPVIIAAAVVIWATLSGSMRLDGFKGGWNFPAIFSQVLVGVCLLMTVLLASAFVVQLRISRLVLVYFGLLSLFGFVLIRWFAKLFFVSRTRAGGVRRAAILGNGNVARELAGRIMRHPEMMCEVVAFISPAGSEPPHLEGKVQCAGGENANTSALPDLFQRHGVQELIIVNPTASKSEMEKLILHCRRLGIRISLVPQWYQLYVSRARLLEIDGLPLLSMEERSLGEFALILKRVVDLAVTPLLAFLASPLVLTAAAALYIRKRKAFRQELRCGKQGTPFVMYRFNIDRDNPGLHGLDRVFAELSLTELPQLWNVLRGDMSLVGPRPEPPERVKHYSEWQRNRLMVVPGLTGLAQVHGLRDRHSSEQKSRFDMQYILDWSPFLDLVLVVRTAWTLIVRACALASASPAPRVQADRGRTATAVDSRPLIPEIAHADSSQPYAD